MLNPDTELVGDTLWRAAALRARASRGRSRRRAHAAPRRRARPRLVLGRAEPLEPRLLRLGPVDRLPRLARLQPRVAGRLAARQRARGRHRHGLPVPRAARGLGAARRLRRGVLHVRRGRRPRGARPQARLPPGDHARRRDRPPRRRVLALGRQARDEPALPRRARPQALVAAARRAAVALLQAGTGVRALGAGVTRRPSSTWPAVWRRRRDWRGGYA